MLNKIIEWSLRNQFLMVVAMIFTVLGGIWSIQQTRLDAYAGELYGQGLVAETDTEYRCIRFKNLPDCGDGVIAGFRIPRTVGQKHTVRFQRQNVRRRHLRRHHGHATAPLHQHT